MSRQSPDSRIDLEALTFDDVLLQPAYSEVLPRQVDLRTPLTSRITLNIPLLSAAMDTVTEANLAIALAQEGGIGIIHKNMTGEAQAGEVRRVKKYESGIIADPITVPPDMTIADVLALTVFLGLVDLPFSDREKLSALVEMAARDPDPAQRIAGIGQIAEYLMPYIEQRRARPGDDLLSHAVNAYIDGRPISLEEAIGASIHLMGAGLDTVSSLFCFSMALLARQPQLRRQLVEDPELIPTAANELIRRFPVVVMVRQVRADMEYLGVSLRQGEMVAIPTPFYNLDESVYERPLEVDWSRKVGKLLSFGNGPHRCPGAVLGRTELVIGLQEWLKRIPDFAIAPGATIPVVGGTVAKILSLPLLW